MDFTRRDILNSISALTLAGVVDAPAREPLTFQAEPPNRSSLEHLLGEMPKRPAASFRTLESVQLENGWRHKIEFLAEPADSLFDAPEDLIRAYLFVPHHRTQQTLPAVIAIHQDGPQSHIGKSEPAGIVGDKNLFYGYELFQRGYVVICPDRFGHAERRRVAPNDLTSIDEQRDDQLLEHRVGQLLLRSRTAFGKEAYDLMVAADVLSTLDYVDQERIGAIGHSAGGHNLVFFMFCDRRIKIGVSSCGLFSLLRFYSESAPKKRISAFAIPGLAAVGDSADYLVGIAPRPILLTRGLFEWGEAEEQLKFSKAHVEETRAIEAHARSAYQRNSASDNLRVIYFDENGGNHDFPPHVRQQAYVWLDQYLKPS